MATQATQATWAHMEYLTMAEAMAVQATNATRAHMDESARILSLMDSNASTEMVQHAPRVLMTLKKCLFPILLKVPTSLSSLSLQYCIMLLHTQDPKLYFCMLSFPCFTTVHNPMQNSISTNQFSCILAYHYLNDNHIQKPYSMWNSNSVVSLPQPFGSLLGSSLLILGIFTCEKKFKEDFNKKNSRVSSL